MSEFRKQFNSALVRAYHNVLRLEETKRKCSRTSTSFRGRNAMEYIYSADEAPDSEPEGMGCRRICDIADYLRITRPSATILIKRLKELDYVYGVSDPDDARSELIYLTRRGRLVTTYQTRHRNEMIDLIISEFSESERDVLYRGFSRLNQVFEDCSDTMESTYSKKTKSALSRGSQTPGAEKEEL